MSDPEDPYRPRESDHLVEPMFAGLGVGEREQVEDGALAQEARRPGLLARVLRWLLGRRKGG